MSNYTYISPKEMDIIASIILKDTKIPTIWEGKVHKVDIDSLIEFDFDLSIVWTDIDDLDAHNMVLAAIKPSIKTIYMNETKKSLFEEKIGTMNFTKAHELGHWVLHVTKQQKYEQLSFHSTELYHCRSSAVRAPEETQADMFAASLLMPRDIVIGAVECLKKKGYVLFPELYNLADQFEVSISAMKNRISSLKLLYFKDKKIYLSEDDVTGQMSFFIN